MTTQAIDPDRTAAEGGVSFVPLPRQREKIYCSRCRHYLYRSNLCPEGPWIPADIRCLSRPHAVDDWMGRSTVYSRPQEKNAENNCPEFEPRPPKPTARQRIKKILRYFWYF